MLKNMGSGNLQHLIIRGAPLFFPLLLLPIGCSRTENVFEIEDSGGRVVAAEMWLCGSKAPMIRSGNLLLGKERIKCEGEGEINLRLVAGAETSCHVGYFTPGLEQKYTYIVEDGYCIPTHKWESDRKAR